MDMMLVLCAVVVGIAVVYCCCVDDVVSVGDVYVVVRVVGVAVGDDHVVVDSCVACFGVSLVLLLTML